MYKKAIQEAILENELPSKWSKDLLKEAKRVAKKKQNTKFRKDLRELPFITIDGEDAKDFDDAVYCAKDFENFKLYIAIADVSFYVEPNSKLDKEAKKRGTSVYFPKKVIPMLPENLSNGICSLKPNEDRCSIICEMLIGRDGKKKKFKFYSGLINSKARLTYLEVENFLSKKQKINQLGVKDSINQLKTLTKLRLMLRKKRKALEIDSKESILTLNRNKDVKNITLKKTLFAHKLIEESMLLANESAAEFMSKKLDFGVFRIHENPDPSKLEALKMHFDVPIKNTNKLLPLNLVNSYLNHALNKKDSIGQILVMQALARAEYSIDNLGHFGLQLKQYTHFTSPIRRYPDLLVHRLITSSLLKEKIIISKDELQDECKNSSKLERRAEKASRQVEQVLICSYLQAKIGEIFDGTVSGVTDFGLFINLESYTISGLLHVSDLPNDRYKFLYESNVLKGIKRGTSYRLGQKIRVQIAAIFPLERKITLTMANGK